jgi:hypothetical protein
MESWRVAVRDMVRMGKAGGAAWRGERGRGGSGVAGGASARGEFGGEGFGEGGVAELVACLK